MEESITNFSVNSELKCYFEFFPTVLIVIGIGGQKGKGRNQFSLAKLTQCFSYSY